MRLIDADAFKDSLAKVASMGHVSLLTIGRTLAQTPTVDAIPITWLKRWGATNWTSYEMTNEVLFDIHFKPIILRAIEDWNKERGTNDE